MSDINVTRRDNNIKVERVERTIAVRRVNRTLNLNAGGKRGLKGDKGDTGDPGMVQSIVAGTNVTVDSTDPANPIVNSTGGSGSGMQIGNEVVDAQPNRALFTDENGDLTDDVIESKEVSFFSGAISGKAIKPTNFTHDDSMLVGGVDASGIGGSETIAVLQSIDRTGGFAYVKVDFNNLDTVPPETIFVIAYDADTQKTQMFYYPNGIFTDPTPFFTIDETGVVVNGSQKYNEIVTELVSATDLQLPTAKAVVDAISAISSYPPVFDADNMQSELQTLVANNAYAVVGSGYNYDSGGFSMDNPGDFADGGFDIYTEVVPLYPRWTADPDTVDFGEVFTIQEPLAWGGDLLECATVMRGGRAFPYVEVTSSESTDPFGEDPAQLVEDYSTPMFMSTRLRYQYDGDTGTLKVYRTVRAGETADDTAFDLDWVEIFTSTKGESWPIAPITATKWQIGKGGGKYLIARVIVNEYDGTPRCDFNPANATDAYTVPDPITGDNWTSSSAYIIQTEDFLQKWLSSESDIPDVPNLVDTDTTTVAVTYDGASTTYRSENADGSEDTGSPRVILSRYTMPEDGKLTSIKVKMGIASAGSCKVRGAVYSNTLNSPDELLATGDEVTITNTTNSYQTITFSGANQHIFSRGDKLWIGVNPEDASPNFVFGTEGSVTEATWLSVGVTYASPLPDPAPAFGYFVNGNLALTITYKNAETGISVSTINESNLNVDNSPTDDYVLTAKASAAGGLTWKAVSGGSVTASSTTTFTNKTIDANGTGNSITNLETADFASNVVDTSAVMTANSDTRLATQKATKARTPIIQPTSGDYYSMGGQTAAATAGITGAGQIRFHPIWLGAGTLDRIAVSTSSAAVSTWRLGLYKADPTTGLPDGQTPFLDAGTVDMNASPGVQAITISQAITEPGLYWAAILCDAYTAQPTTHNCIYSSNTGVGILGLPQDMSSLGRYRVGRTYGSTVSTGSLPTAPTGVSMTWAGVIPRVAVRYA